jgi:replicative DNA helicase
LKDSASIFQDLDWLIIMHRNEEKKEDHDGVGNAFAFNPMTGLTVIGRWGGGGSVTLYFNGKRSKFVERGLTFEKELKRWRNRKRPVGARSRRT